MYCTVYSQSAFCKQQSATAVCNSSLQQQSATAVCNISLQQQSATAVCNSSLPQQSATAVCNSSLQQQSATAVCHSSLQHQSATAVCNSSLQQQTATAVCHSSLPQQSATAVCNSGLQQQFATTFVLFQICRLSSNRFFGGRKEALTIKRRITPNKREKIYIQWIMYLISTHILCLTISLSRLLCINTRTNIYWTLCLFSLLYL